MNKFQIKKGSDPFYSPAGFTLIELLIVIVIISIVASFAVLSINVNQNKRLESMANQWVNTMQLAEQEALFNSVTLGLAVTPSTFQFYEYHPQNNAEKNPWSPSSQELLGLHHIPGDINLTLKIQGKTVTSSQPKVIISPGGDLTPFTLYIGKKGSDPLYKITGTANGNITSGPVHEE